MQQNQIKKAIDVDTSNFAKKTNSPSLKLDGDELDIDKIKTVPVDVSKITNLLTNCLVCLTILWNWCLKGSVML